MLQHRFEFIIDARVFDEGKKIAASSQSVAGPGCLILRRRVPPTSSIAYQHPVLVMHTWCRDGGVGIKLQMLLLDRSLWEEDLEMDIATKMVVAPGGTRPVGYFLKCEQIGLDTHRTMEELGDLLPR